MKVFFLIVLLVLFPVSVKAYDGSNVLQLVNNYRSDRGLSVLRTSSLTCRIASIRSKEIIKAWKHDIWGRFYGYNVLGENLSKGFSQAEDILTAWDRSPSHNANLNGEYIFGCVVCVGNYCALEMIR